MLGAMSSKKVYLEKLKISVDIRLLQNVSSPEPVNRLLVSKSLLSNPGGMASTLSLVNMTSSLIDTLSSVTALVDSIVDLPNEPPSLYFDLEGLRLSREGLISTFQLLLQSQHHVYLIDIYVLGSSALNTSRIAWYDL